MNKPLKAVFYFAPIIFLFVIGFSFKDQLDGVPDWVVFAVAIICIVIGPVIATSIYEEKLEDKVEELDLKQKLQDIKRGIKTKVQHQKELKEIEELNRLLQSKKESLRYLAPGTLTAKWKELVNRNDESIERLALEEILVEKGILEYSPLHEEFNQALELYRRVSIDNHTLNS